MPQHRPARAPEEVQAIIEGVVRDIRAGERHRIAAYEPDERPPAADRDAMPDAPEERPFGIAVALKDGPVLAAGDHDRPFPIQSISKLFALELALEAVGEELWERVGREPSGDPFNSIIDLERDRGIPRNPFINAGALVTIDALMEATGGRWPERTVERFVARLLKRRDVPIDPQVAAPSDAKGSLNRALLELAGHHGNIQTSIDLVSRAYGRACAITLDCGELARAGRFLLVDPADAARREAAVRARRIMAVMMLTGPYDRAGDFAYRVGLPAKSGVGGGILAIVPHVASIAVWSPDLDPAGNSILGTLGLELLTDRIDWSVFGMVRTSR